VVKPELGASSRPVESAYRVPGRLVTLSWRYLYARWGQPWQMPVFVGCELAWW